MRPLRPRIGRRTLLSCAASAAPATARCSTWSIGGAEPVEFTIVGTRSGLPPAAAPLVRARPATARAAIWPGCDDRASASGCGCRREIALVGAVVADLFQNDPPQPARAAAGRECAARRPAAAAAARRGRRPGASDRAGRRDRADGRGGQARLDDPVGAARHRQDHDRAAARRRGRHALRRHLGGLLGRRRPQEGVRRGARAYEDRPADLAVRGRDPPLQPRPAGRLPALCRGRHGRAGRRDHRKSELRAERRPAQPRAGADPQPARRRRACANCSTGPRS